jgi:hypothetical protein
MNFLKDKVILNVAPPILSAQWSMVACYKHVLNLRDSKYIVSLFAPIIKNCLRYVGFFYNLSALKEIFELLSGSVILLSTGA